MLYIKQEETKTLEQGLMVGTVILLMALMLAMVKLKDPITYENTPTTDVLIESRPMTAVEINKLLDDLETAIREDNHTTRFNLRREIREEIIRQRQDNDI